MSCDACAYWAILRRSLPSHLQCEIFEMKHLPYPDTISHLLIILKASHHFSQYIFFRLIQTGIRDPRRPAAGRRPTDVEQHQQHRSGCESWE